MNTRLSPISVSDPEKRVLEAYIHYHRSYPNKVPSFRQIGERAGIPIRAVPDYIRRLEERGLITYQHQRSIIGNKRIKPTMRERFKRRLNNKLLIKEK